MKTSYFNRGLSAISALALGLTALATPQLAAAQTTSSTSGCVAGTACPGTSQIGISAVANGTTAYMGAFGSFNQAGERVVDDTLEGEVQGYQEGTSAVLIDAGTNGLCTTCQNTTGTSRVQLNQTSGVASWLTGRQAGVVYAGAGTTTAAGMGAVSTVFLPYKAP